MKRALGILAISLIVIWSCKKDDNVTPIVEIDNGLQTEVYASIANKQIIPAYDSLETRLKIVVASLEAFETSPSQTALDQLQEDFKAAYSAYQYVLPFEFGPAEEKFFLSVFNNFPVGSDSTDIKNAVSSGNYNLLTSTYALVVGFPATEYMLFSKGDNTLDYLANTDNALTFTKDNVQLVLDRTSAIKTAWSSYKSTFINNVGNSGSSSLSYLVNNVNIAYELVKRAKIGLPVGKNALAKAYPDQIEAYYQGNSVQMAIEAVEACREVFTGADNGLGLNDLIDATGATSGSTALSKKLILEIDEAIAALKAINDPLSESIVSQKATVENAYDELQEVVKYMKSDVPAALQIGITYEDGDGD